MIAYAIHRLTEEVTTDITNVTTTTTTTDKQAKAKEAFEL